jgi:glycerate kinase
MLDHFGLHEEARLVEAAIEQTTAAGHLTRDVGGGVTAVVEVANTCGLALLPGGTLEPLSASSRGFGEAVLFALSLKPARIVLALGGSASTDGGMGMLTALGYVFRDAEGRQLYGSGGALAQIHSVQRTALPELADTEFVVASDVHNPLLGTQAAPAVFGPQKGCRPLGDRNPRQRPRTFRCQDDGGRVLRRGAAGRS